MAEIFSYDSIFIRMLNRVGDVMLLSILFVVTSIPIFTIGTSITALYYAAMKGVKGDDGYVFKNYMKSFKENFKQSTIMWLILVGVLFVFGVDLWFWIQQAKATASAISKGMIVISVVLLAVAVMITMYVFPLQSKFDNKTSIQFRNAFLLSIKNFPITLLLAALTFVIGWCFYYKPALAVVGFAMAGFGIAGYVYAYFMSICFKPFLEPVEEVVDETEEDWDDEEEIEEEEEEETEKIEEIEE